MGLKKGNFLLITSAILIGFLVWQITIYLDQQKSHEEFLKNQAIERQNFRDRGCTPVEGTTKWLGPVK